MLAAFGKGSGNRLRTCLQSGRSQVILLEVMSVAALPMVQNSALAGMEAEAGATVAGAFTLLVDGEDGQEHAGRVHAFDEGADGEVLEVKWPETAGWPVAAPLATPVPEPVVAPDAPLGCALAGQTGGDSPAVAGEIRACGLPAMPSDGNEAGNAAAPDGLARYPHEPGESGRPNLPSWPDGERVKTTGPASPGAAQGLESVAVADDAAEPDGAVDHGSGRVGADKAAGFAELRQAIPGRMPVAEEAESAPPPQPAKVTALSPEAVPATRPPDRAIQSGRYEQPGSDPGQSLPIDQIGQAGDAPPPMSERGSARRGAMAERPPQILPVTMPQAPLATDWRERMRETGQEEALPLLAAASVAGTDPGRDALTLSGTVRQEASGPRALVHDLARQLAGSLTQGQDRPVELVLSPEELGRVRLTIVSDDRGLTMTLMAERPETLDLMRRNIDLLAQDFRSLGFGTLNFAFTHEGNRPPAQPDGGLGQGSAAVEPPEPAMPRFAGRGLADAGGAACETLDLRL